MSGINIKKKNTALTSYGLFAVVGAPYILIINASVACQLRAIMYTYRHVRSYFARRKYMDLLFMIGVQFQVALCHIFSIQV